VNCPVTCGGKPLSGGGERLAPEARRTKRSDTRWLQADDDDCHHDHGYCGDNGNQRGNRARAMSVAREDGPMRIWGHATTVRLLGAGNMNFD